MTTLILADHNNTSLQAAMHNTVTAAQKIGGDIHMLVAGLNAGAAAAAAAAIAGVTKVLHVEAPHFASPTAENLAATVVMLVKAGGYSHVLAPATGFGKNVAPRVAALPPVAAAASKPVARTVMTLIESVERTVASTLPA